MKVLHIYKDYYPPVKGGIEKHVNLLANGLRDRGIGVEILVSNTRFQMEVENINGITVYKVPQIGRLSSAPLNFTLPLWIKRLGVKADILHFQFPNPTAEFSYLLSGLNEKFVITYQSDIIKQVYLKRLYSPFMNEFLRRSSKIIVTSPQYLNTSKTLRKFRKKCEVIPLGIDVERGNCCCDRKQKVARLRQRFGKPLVLFVGKFRYYKGVHVLIEAMRQIDAKLLLLGPELDTKPIQSLIGECELHEKIVILGELPDNDLYDYLHACDIFVLPSIKRSEAFGIVQLEAMACGKPLVCTELGTGTSFVNAHEKTGLVVQPNDPDALAGAVNHLLHNPGIREKYGENGRFRVKNLFSLSKMVDSTLLLYQQILNR